MVTAGALPTGLSLDSLTGEITGFPEQSGDFTFSVKVSDYFNAASNETKEFTISVNPPPFAPGDYNQDNNINLIDILEMISYVYEDAAAPPDLNLGDVDHSCAIDLVDILYLIDFIYNDGPAPLMGCVVPW